MNKLYKEVVNDETERRLTPNEQVNPSIMLQVVSTKLIEATEDEIIEAKTKFNNTNSCDYHLVYDDVLMFYYERKCGICNKSIALV